MVHLFCFCTSFSFLQCEVSLLHGCHFHEKNLYDILACEHRTEVIIFKMESWQVSCFFIIYSSLFLFLYVMLWNLKKIRINDDCEMSNKTIKIPLYFATHRERHKSLAKAVSNKILVFFHIKKNSTTNLF